MVAEVNGANLRGKDRAVAMESVKAMAKSLPGEITFEIRNESDGDAARESKEANLQDVTLVVDATAEQKAQISTMITVAAEEQRESWLVESLLDLMGYKIVRSRLKLVKDGHHRASSSVSSTNPFEDLASEEAKGNTEAKAPAMSSAALASEAAQAAAKLAAKAGDSKEESAIIQSLMLATLASGREVDGDEVGGEGGNAVIAVAAATDATATAGTSATTPKVLSKKERRQSAKAARDLEMKSLVLARPTNSANKRNKRKTQRRKSSNFGPMQV